MSTMTKLQLEGATQQWVASFMTQNQVSASDMETALTKIICKLKDDMITEMLLELQQPPAEEPAPEE